MTLGIMQPYFFPYIGYWQLIKSVDVFVLFDDVQYIRHGWINRNRMLKPGGGWQYIVLPIKKHSQNTLIKMIKVDENIDWKSQIIRQLEHYRHSLRAPFYYETMEFLDKLFSSINGNSVVDINKAIIIELTRLLGIETEILVSSEKNFDYSMVNDSGDWALAISEQMGAEEYRNPVNGAPLFDVKKFSEKGIRLSFLQSSDIEYSQGRSFEPSLSILDALMFNGADVLKNLLDKYSITTK